MQSAVVIARESAVIDDAEDTAGLQRRVNQFHRTDCAFFAIAVVDIVKVQCGKRRIERTIFCRNIGHLLIKPGDVR